MNRSEEMGALLGRWRESGLSLHAFAKREEISYSKLQYWATKLRGGKKERAKTEPVELVPVRVAPEPKAAEPISIWLANGIALEVPSGFDGAEVRRLVGVLSEC